MLIKIILKKSFLKLYDSLGGLNGFLSFIFIILFYSITMIIRIFWSPIESLMWKMPIILLLIFTYTHRPNNYLGKLNRIKNMANLGKYEKCLVKVNKFLAKDVSKLKGNKKALIYHRSILLKGLCLLHLGVDYENLEKIEESIPLFDEVLKYNLRKNTNINVSELMLRIGTSYLNLGRLKKDENYLEKALDIFEKELANNESKDQNFLINIYTRISYTYKILSQYYCKEEHLKKSLEALNYVYDLYSKMNDLNGKSFINMLKGEVLRKLYEINHDENHKQNGINALNEALVFYKNTINPYSKRYFIDDYSYAQFYIGQIYFELFKLNNLEDDLKNSKTSLNEASIYYTKEKISYYTTQIIEMLNDLNAHAVNF